MSNPSLARNDEVGHRFYTFGEPPETFWSVTTLIDGGVPKFLVPWATKLVAELVFEDLSTRGPYAGSWPAIRRWARAGRLDVAARQAAGELTSIKLHKLTEDDLAKRWLKGTPERIRRLAADLGSDVHAEAEDLVASLAFETGIAWTAGRALPEWPARLEAHMRSFIGFLDAWRPTFLATEASVFNRTQSYAGTLDAIIAIPAHLLAEAIERSGEVVPGWLRARAPDAMVVVIVDYKSGRAVYSTVALQLAAYARAEFVGLSDGVTRLPMPVVDAGAVLHITPDGCRFRLVRIDDAVFAAFLHACEVYRWAKQTSASALLQELTPPNRAEESIA